MILKTLIYLFLSFLTNLETLFGMMKMIYKTSYVFSSAVLPSATHNSLGPMGVVLIPRSMALRWWVRE